MNKSGNRVCLFGAALLVAMVPAQASTLQYSLSISGCSSSCGTPPFATILLDQTSATAVTVTETLKAGELYAGGGAGDALGFNLLGGAATISNLSTGFEVGPANTKYSTFGDFQYSIKCTICKGGQDTNAPGPLSFVVSRASGLTLADFTVNADGFYFASDIVGTTGATGNVGTAGPSVPSTATPEPVSMLLAGAGLLGLGLVRRFPRKAAQR